MGDPPSASKKELRPGRRSLLLSLTGFLLAFLSLATYFVLAPRWPDWRDSGVANAAAAGIGAAIGFVGLWRTRRPRLARTLSALLFSLGLACALFLSFYIFHLSYQLPPGDAAVAVGVEAPEFRLPDQEGRERSLEDFAGRYLVLVFFRGHW